MTTNHFFRDLLQKAGVIKGTPTVGEIRARREAIRSVYSTELGRKELTRLLLGGSVFTHLDASDTEEIARHNMMVDLMDDMGLLDEANMERLVGYMLTLPVIPDWVAKE